MWLVAGIICALVFSGLALAAAGFALVKVLAFENSTHKIMMYNPATDSSTPLGGEFSGNMSDELKDKFQGDGEFAAL